MCVCIYIYIERERYVRSKFLSSLTLSQTLKGFADDHFKFDENGRKFSKLVEHSIGKREMLIMNNFSFSNSVFKRLVLQTRKNQGLFGKGLTNY